MTTAILMQGINDSGSNVVHNHNFIRYHCWVFHVAGRCNDVINLGE